MAKLNLFDLIDVSKLPDGDASLLEEQGLCLAIGFSEPGTAFIMPVKTYEVLCNFLGFEE